MLLHILFFTLLDEVLVHYSPENASKSHISAPTNEPP